MKLWISVISVSVMDRQLPLQAWGRIRIYNGSTWLNTIEENWQAWQTGTEDGSITTDTIDRAKLCSVNVILLI